MWGTEGSTHHWAGTIKTVNSTAHIWVRIKEPHNAKGVSDVTESDAGSDYSVETKQGQVGIASAWNLY